MKNNIISFSGGKDSTAMALEMLERGEDIHSVIAFDTGWEFPAMMEHWDKFEEYTGLEIVRLRPEETFTYWLFERPIVSKQGPNKGEVHRHGNGWPSAMRRWCTREKMNHIHRYYKEVENPIPCIGYAADEEHRVARNSESASPAPRYPLIEWGIDEAQALAICKRHGFDWGGLYNHFDRVSCYCCPLQRIGELRTLRREYPDLWSNMMQWEVGHEEQNRGFRGYETVHDLEDRFAEEDRLGDAFNIRRYNKERRALKTETEKIMCKEENN